MTPALSPQRMSFLVGNSSIYYCVDGELKEKKNMKVSLQYAILLDSAQRKLESLYYLVGSSDWKASLTPVT